MGRGYVKEKNRLAFFAANTKALTVLCIKHQELFTEPVGDELCLKNSSIYRQLTDELENFKPMTEHQIRLKMISMKISYK